MIELVDQYRQTEDFHGVARVYFTRVPAFTASTIVWECPSWPGIVMTFARHPFDEQRPLDLIRHVNGAWDGDTGGKGMRIRPGLSDVASGRMDVAVILRPPHLYKVGTVDPALDPLTAFCFPAYSGEFSGDESPEEFDDLIHTTAGVGSWDRKRVGNFRTR